MNMIYFTFLFLHACFSVMSMVNGQNCQKMTQLSGEISDSYSSYSPFDYSKCWFIEVPEDSYARLDIKELLFSDSTCHLMNMKIFVKGDSETYTFCGKDNRRKPIIALNDVNITVMVSVDYLNMIYDEASSFSFRLQFTTGLFSPIRKLDMCSEEFLSMLLELLHSHEVCDGIKDCKNGADEVGCERGVMAVKGMNISRMNAINWLKNQRTQTFGWDKNTHRAITALYLSNAMSFQGDDDVEEELIAKQLELQTSVALLRNASDPVSINELSMFVNALAVTCHNPRRFYGYDLLQILSDRVASAKSPVPSAYLTLCNPNWTLSDSDIQNLVNLLYKNQRYPFHSDIRALALMALTCAKNKTENFRSIVDAESLYESTIENFLRQFPDGSFGNVYTTALVTQALISSGQEENKQWNVTATVRYLMKHLNSSSVDFLSVYLTLPIFSGKSLVDIKGVDCSNKTRTEGKDKDILEVTDKLGGKMQIRYSLYIGDQKDVVHTMYLRVPENSSAFDVMRVAEVADPKYKFLYREDSDVMYVYEIAGIINDPEAGKFWLLYTGDDYVNGTVDHHADSPDKFILEANNHLIMWYRTAHI